MQYIQDLLFEKQDKAFAEFHRRLVPNLEPQKVIGVRTPQLRALAKQIAKEEICEAFLKELPHEYYEENQLHGFILSQMKDFDTCIQYLEVFLPYMDNWATCDQTSPKIFKSHKEELLPYIYKWIQKEHTYTVLRLECLCSIFWMKISSRSMYGRFRPFSQKNTISIWKLPGIWLRRLQNSGMWSYHI